MMSAISTSSLDISTSDTTSISLLTFVLQAHHCAILEDWFRFFDSVPEKLIVHIGQAPQVRENVTALCERYGIELNILGVANAEETTLRERELLHQQFGAVKSSYACIVRLDTIPFRATGITWQAEAFRQMLATGAKFITGVSLAYRTDRASGFDNLLLTQRISNCFLLITPEFWYLAQTGMPGCEERYGRFVVEGAVEDYLAAHDAWGIRMLNSPSLRIFHCQEWGPRLIEVRQAFQRGYRIHRYLRGFQDDARNQRRYYLKPPLPFRRRFRILLGRWKRQLLG